MHPSGLLVETSIWLVSYPTTVADIWIVQFCNTYFGRPATNIELGFTFWNTIAPCHKRRKSSDAYYEEIRVDCRLLARSFVSIAFDDKISKPNGLCSAFICEIVRIWLEVTIPAFADPNCMFCNYLQPYCVLFHAWLIATRCKCDIRNFYLC